jgi:peptidoglycan/LPS O-acetylase OafA/YrhL
MDVVEIKTSPEQEHADAAQPDTGTKMNRRSDIQGMRAIAVLMVVAFHAGLPVPGGFVGVDVFFVISGFVITNMLKQEWVTTGRIRFGAFYIRRFKRLTPALALMVTVTTLTSALVLSPLGTQQTAALTAIGAMLVVGNIVISRTTGGYFDAPANTNPLLNVWSLSVEEQFYLVFPAVLAAGWLISRRARSLRVTPSVLVLSVAVVSFASLYMEKFVVPHTQFLFGFYGPVSRAWEFSAGAILALAASRAAIKSPRLAMVFGVLGVLLLASSMWLIDGTARFPGPLTLLPVIGTLLLLLAGSQNSNPVARALAAKIMIKVGDWSYSIYLWHWPLIVFATFLWPNSSAAVFAAALLAFAPALASYKWIEQPLRNLSDVSGPRLARIALTTLLPPLVVSGGVWTAASHGFWSPTVTAYQAAIFPSHAGTAAGCDGSVPLGVRLLISTES